MPNYWRPYAQATLKLENKFVPYIVGVITSFREAFINDLQDHGKEYALSQLSLRTIHDQLAPLLTAIYKTCGLMGAKMTAVEHKTLLTPRDRQQINLYLRQRQGSKSMQIKASGSIGKNEQWVKDVLNYLQTHMMGFVQDITDTMRNDILRILQNGVNEGMSIPEIVNALKQKGLIEARAQVIARTEINRASNVGHATSAKSLPYEVDKGWVGAGDHRERHSHLMTNDHTVGEIDTFEVPVFDKGAQIGTDHMQFPGDPNAHPSNTINCRCRVVYKPKRDANGRLIMREQSQAAIVPMGRSTTYTPAQIAAELKANIVVTVK